MDITYYNDFSSLFPTTYYNVMSPYNPIPHLTESVYTKIRDIPEVKGLSETALELINNCDNEFKIMFCLIQALHYGSFIKNYQECTRLLCKQHTLSLGKLLKNVITFDLNTEYKITQYEMCSVINKYPECLKQLKKYLVILKNYKVFSHRNNKSYLDVFKTKDCSFNKHLYIDKKCLLVGWTDNFPKGKSDITDVNIFLTKDICIYSMQLYDGKDLGVNVIGNIHDMMYNDIKLCNITLSYPLKVEDTFYLKNKMVNVNDITLYNKNSGMFISAFIKYKDKKVKPCRNIIKYKPPKIINRKVQYKIQQPRK